MTENPSPVPPPLGGAPKIVVKLAPLSGSQLKSETLKITLPPRSDSGMKPPVPLMVKPSAPTVPLAPPAPPAPPAANLVQEVEEKTLKIGVSLAPSSKAPTAPLAPPKLQTAQIHSIAPKPLPSAPVPRAITEPIPVGVMPPRPVPKPATPPLSTPSAVKPEAPKLSAVTVETKSINLATPQAPLPNPGISAQGPASIPPKVAVPGTAPRPGVAPLPPKPEALGGKPNPAAKAAALGAPLSSSGGSAPAISKSPMPKSAVPSDKPVPLRATPSQDLDESEAPSLLITILAVFAAVLATGVAVYLYLEMSKYGAV